MQIPIKKEKLSERLVFFVPPSTKKLLSELEAELGLDVPEFARKALRRALEELKARTKR